MTRRIGGGGAFDDTDGDGTAELQDDNADFQGGEARNVGGIQDASSGNTYDVDSLAGGAVSEMETGQVTFNDPGTAATGDWNDYASDIQSVAFSSAFSTPPKPLIDGTFAYGAVSAYNQSTTGFDAKYRNYASDASGSNTSDWVAII